MRKDYRRTWFWTCFWVAECELFPVLGEKDHGEQDLAARIETMHTYKVVTAQLNKTV